MQISAHHAMKKAKPKDMTHDELELYLVEESKQQQQQHRTLPEALRTGDM